jgi:hypothetical protein
MCVNLELKIYRNKISFISLYHLRVSNRTDQESRFNFGTGALVNIENRLTMKIGILGVRVPIPINFIILIISN